MTLTHLLRRTSLGSVAELCHPTWHPANSRVPIGLVLEDDVSCSSATVWQQTVQSNTCISTHHICIYACTCIDIYRTTTTYTHAFTAATICVPALNFSLKAALDLHRTTAGLHMLTLYVVLEELLACCGCWDFTQSQVNACCGRHVSCEQEPHFMLEHMVCSV